MSDSLEELRRVSTGRRAAPSGSSGGDEDEATCPAFGYLRGLRDQALHVSFRFANGSTVTMPYSWLGPCRHHPSTGIVLLFAGGELFLVTLKGRNLDAVLETGVSLYERGLARHRVTWVRESSATDARSPPDGACVVEHIAVRVVKPEEVGRALGLSA